MRLVEEVEPSFIFLENVPAIRTRGLDRVLQELAKRGYDSRWSMLSAKEVGAPHLRNRWFLLAAHPDRLQRRNESITERGQGSPFLASHGQAQPLADAVGEGLEIPGRKSAFEWAGWWAVEPDVGRVANGIACRVDRIKVLGNGVVPAQVREAFRSLIYGS
jgi:DNA (cytosine-5)-methyltransferase 1